MIFFQMVSDLKGSVIWKERQTSKPPNLSMCSVVVGEITTSQLPPIFRMDFRNECFDEGTNYLVML